MKDYEPKIYLNNAATSWPKPDCVAGAMAEALENLPGDAGRGGIRDFHIFDQVRKELADLMNVSVKTVEHWESSRGTVKGAAAALLGILWDRMWLAEELEIPEKTFPLRLRYMYHDRLCTVIDVEERQKRIKIKNFVQDPVFCAFGRNENPDYKDYEEFLESRCFPRTRDKMKIMLEELNLPFYDPFLIVQKTEGRMAEDDFWIQIEE